MDKAHKFQHTDWHPYREFVIKRRARKHHFCDECGGMIWSGTEYYADTFGREHNPRRAGSSDYYTHKVCEECWRGKELKA